MNTCKTCEGKKTVTSIRKTLGGIRHTFQSCNDCMGTGIDLPTITFRGVEVLDMTAVEGTENYYVIHMDTYFNKYETVQAMINDSMNYINRHNSEIDGVLEDFMTFEDFCKGND